MTGLPDQSQRAAFLSTVQGKLISTLTIIALVLGIAAEGISIYTGWNEAIIKTNQARKAEIETRIGNMVMTPETSRKKLCDDPIGRAKFPDSCDEPR